jgi:hypothetical protein
MDFFGVIGFLRDPIWQFIGVVISIIAIIVAVRIYRKSTKKRTLLFCIRLFLSISSFNYSDRLKTKAVFDGVSLPDINLVALEIWNGGNKEILPESFQRPLLITFQKDAKILDV